MIEDYLLTVGRVDILEQVTKVQDSMPTSSAGKIKYHLERNSKVR